MMKRLFVLLIFGSLMLAACNDASNEKQANASLIEVQVDFMTPQKLSYAKSIPLQVKLTQDEQIIDDATSVNFEIWASGEREKAQMFEAKYVKDGIYEAAVNVEKEGVYYVYAHTEARGMHVMPKKKFIIGAAAEKKIEKD